MKVNKSEQLHIRVTPRELAMVETCAHVAGLTTSRYLVRIAYLNYKQLMQCWNEGGIPSKFANMVMPAVPEVQKSE